MFSFLKFLNPKSDADKDKSSNSLSGKTLNLNSPEARALNIFNHKSPTGHKTNGNTTSLRLNCKETVTSPGFSYRVAQKAREMRPSSPNTDDLNLSTSYTLDLNGSSLTNNSTLRDMYDKKRKLMETLDNFGVRKRTRQESGVDTFANRRRRTISESNAPDRITTMNGHNHRLLQPVSAVMSPKIHNIENKPVKRHGDFGTNTCLSQKKPRTRNNEILSSYSSSKFLLTPGQKRPYPIDNGDSSPKRKHCKSCTCCGSTIILEDDQNNLNKSDKTTETESSDDLVTVAASRIFNRSGKPQVVKRISMKTILDQVLDDDDPVPYTSIEKVEEKKKNGQKEVSIQPLGDKSVPVSPILSSTASVSNVTLTTKSLVQSSTPLTFGVSNSESTSKLNEGIKNNTPLQFNFGSPTASSETLAHINHKQTNELDGKVIENETPKSINNIITQNIQDLNKQQESLLQSSELSKTNDITKNKSDIEKPLNSNNDEKNPASQFTVPTSKSVEPVSNSLASDNSSKLQMNNSEVNKLPVIQFGSPSSTEKSLKEAVPSLIFGAQTDNSSKQSAFTFKTPKTDENKSTPVVHFGTPKTDENKQTSEVQFGTSKADKNLSTPVMQFGANNANEKLSTPIMQFGATNANEKLSTSIMQFGATKADEKQSTPIMQFGAPNANEKLSTPIMQFGATKADEKKSTPLMQFGASKAPENALFSFGGNNQNTSESAKPTEQVKFQFSAKPDNASVIPTTEPKNPAFGSNNLQNQNVFSFGKTDNSSLATSGNPKYDAATEKSTPKLQFGSMPSPVFGTSVQDQSKPQFSTSVGKSLDNQGPKLVFGSQITENNPTTSTPSINFGNNTTNPVFQFNSSGSKPNEKPSEISGSTFQFSSTKTAPAFGASASQSFGDKPAFQFNAQKSDASKTQFSTPAFGSQSTTTAPFTFGSNEKSTAFGNTFSPSGQQPLKFANKSETKAEPFKFGSTVPSNNAFQFGNNKPNNGPVQFGQTANTFSTPAFSGFGGSAPQTTFGNVSTPQPSPFGSMTSPGTAPAFGSVASPTSNTFGTNQGFQFGSTNNAPSGSSTFAFGSSSQPPKPDGAFSFNAASTNASSFQFGQTPALSTPQIGTQPQGAFGFGSPPMAAAGSSPALFSMGTAPVERRKAKAVRRRQ